MLIIQDSLMDERNHSQGVHNYKRYELCLGRRLPGADLALITGPTGRGVVGGEGSIWSLLTLGVVWYVYLVPPPKYSNPTPAGSKSSVRKGSY